jgi:hypothetical protein
LVGLVRILVLAQRKALVKNRLGMLAALTFASILALTGCAAAPVVSAPTVSAESGNLLAENDLNGLNAKQIIERLDSLPVTERSQGFFASIRPDSLIVSDQGGREVSLPMPENEFYVSVAPYVTQTHDCFFHSLTTCLGELQNEEVQVTIINADGAVLVDGSYRTFSNGFLGFWLPRDISATITLEHNGQSVTAPLSTSVDDPTCVTTLQLT